MVAQADLPFDNRVRNWSAASGFKTNRASGMVYPVGPHLAGEGPGMVYATVTQTQLRRKSPIRERGRLLDWVLTPRGPPKFVRC